MRRHCGSVEAQLVYATKMEVRSTYLADEVERHHVSGLSGDGVWRELELVVCCYRDHHSRGRCGQALGKSRVDDSGE